MAATGPVTFPAMVDYQYDRRWMTTTEMRSALTYVCDRLDDDRIGRNPALKYGYPTDDVVTYNEWTRMVDNVNPMEQSTMSWVGYFDDREEQLIQFHYHDQGLWDRLYDVENMRRGRVLAMGKGYQSAYSQSFPFHLPRTYMVLFGEVSVIIYVAYCRKSTMTAVMCCTTSFTHSKHCYDVHSAAHRCIPVVSYLRYRFCVALAALPYLRSPRRG
jgi:hypothetical protein